MPNSIEGKSKANLINLYNKKCKLKYLIKKFKVPGLVIKNTLFNEGIRPNFGRNRTLTTKDVKIIEYYKSGKNIAQIIEKFKTSYMVVYNLLLSNGIKLRSLSETLLFGQNQYVFKNINTEDKAYWLGFILADGSVNKANSIRVNLQNSDINHLRKLQKFLNSTNDLYYNKCNGCICFSFQSEIMTKDLAKYGIVPLKLGKCYKSDLIPKSLEKHFWRGVVDGDGSLHEATDYYVHKQVQYPKLALCGDLKLMQDFIKYAKRINKDINITARKCGKIYETSTCMGKAMDIIINLYKGSTIYLDRKYKRYKEYNDRYIKNGAYYNLQVLSEKDHINKHRKTVDKPKK